MRIVDWLNRFIAEHQARHPRDDWPSEGSPEARRLWSMLFDEFKRLKADFAEATAASAEVNNAAVEYYGQHVSVLAHAVEAIRERPKAPPAGALDLPMPVSQLNDAERMAEATRMLGEWRQAGWSFTWDAAEQKLYPKRIISGIPTMSREWCARFRLLRDEVYTLMGRPIEDEFAGLDMDRFRDSSGKFQWRKMAAELSRRTVVEGADVGVEVGF